MIPKKIYFYWNGNKLPYLRYLTILSFLKYHPGWELKFLHENSSEFNRNWISPEHEKKIICSDENNYIDRLMNLSNVEYINFNRDKFYEDVYSITNKYIKKNISCVHISDILRTYLIYMNGGIWADMDIIFTSSIDEYLKKKYENINLNINSFFISNRNSKHIGHLIGFIGGEKHLELWLNILLVQLNVIEQSGEKVDYQTLGSTLFNQVVPFEKATTYLQDHKINTHNIDDVISHIDDNILAVNENNKKVNYCNLNTNILYKVSSNNLNILYENMDLPNRKNLLNYLMHDSIGIHWYGGHKESIDYINNYTYGRSKCLMDHLILNI